VQMRSRRLFVAAGALVAAMILLALVQYRWLTDMRDGERARRQIEVRNGARNVAESVDDAIRRAYLACQEDAHGSTSHGDLLVL